MYHFGKIATLPSLTERGTIKGLDGKTYFYQADDCQYPIAKGKLCGFQLYFNSKSRNHPRKIQRAFLSKDRKFIIDRPKSHLHQGITPQLLKVMCAQIICEKAKTIKMRVDFKKIIGKSNCVPISEKDEIIYAERVGRYGHSKFVLNREPEPTKSATIVLKKTLNYYKILTAYIGTPSELEPKDSRATAESIRFWENHALVFGSEPIKKATIVKECPWTFRKRNTSNT